VSPELAQAARLAAELPRPITAGRALAVAEAHYGPAPLGQLEALDHWNAVGALAADMLATQ
jgi:hypothetical protein